VPLLLRITSAFLVLCMFFIATEAKNETVDLPFEKCVKLIRETAAVFGSPPEIIVQKNDFWVVRIPTNDGSLLISCNHRDHSMIVTKGHRKNNRTGRRLL